MPRYFGVNELREMFLRFFESKDHLRLPSFSLIPQNDNSLLLINSGMAPMKPWFTGEQKPPHPRVCSCQKCIRTGDIENIGKTARHATYFEMLGNFSFGDYFKEEAIRWCWEFLQSPDWVGMEAERLYPSVYEEDEEAFAIWRDQIGIPPERITKLGKEHNFWEHGKGPCGPCSEVYYDRGAAYGCGAADCAPGCDCDRFLEIWNNVFTQFESDGAGNYSELSQKNIDTGMGLERLAVICQGVPSLFDVDTMQRISKTVSELTGAHYGQSEKTDVSLRIITDHIRSATFMICDGVLPSNEGRGYVLRRLLRRAARHGKLLGVEEPFLFTLCGTVIAENEAHYTDLREKAGYITRVISEEERSFAKTIDAGMKMFEELMAAHKNAGTEVFSGEDAFRLYDTYGFPIDLTEEMVADGGMTLARDAFEREMDAQRTRARKAREALGDLGWAGIEFGAEVPETRFVGYEENDVSARITALVAEGEERQELGEGAEGILVLDVSPFYAEQGGQAADQGSIESAGAHFAVDNVQKNKGGKYMHYGRVTRGQFRLGDAVRASYDAARRSAIRRAHSATHLLQAALVELLGEHVHQAGSLVLPDKLRFDFTHFSALTAEELSKLQQRVNEMISEGSEVSVLEMSMEEAKAKGATALFGEKYGDTVRVVCIGADSMELCGGTHLDNSAMAAPFHILSEFSVASGVRRIEASTGAAALSELLETERRLAAIAEQWKVKPEALEEKLGEVQEEQRNLKRELAQYQAKESQGAVGNLLQGAKELGGLKLLTKEVNAADANALRQLGDFLRDQEPAVVAVLAAQLGGKLSFLAVCGKAAIEKGIKAGELVRHVTAICGGKGGGKAESAMGGGNDLTKLSEALASVEPLLREKLGI